MRVLVTRPEPGCDSTAALLRAMGHEPVKLPLFRRIFHAEALKQIGNPSALIVTSANAVRALENAPDLEPAHLRIPVFAVGAATAAAANAHGFADVITGPGNGRGLAGLLLDRIASGDINPSPDRPLTYLAGIPRSPDLEQRLTAAGTIVKSLQVYEMSEISYSTDFINGAILSPSLDTVLLYSANAARRAAKLLGPQTQTAQRIECRFLCLSSEIAAALPSPWRDHAIVAATPDEASLLASLAALR